MAEALRAEMAARVLGVAFNRGAMVAAEDPLPTPQSMSMKIPVLGRSNGTATEIPVVPGTIVREGDVLGVTG
jgi:biotin carboxyl carrier protein